MDTNIRIFDRDINFLGEVDNFTSLFYIRKWETYGEFEFHIKKFNKELIKKGNIIMLNNDGNLAGIIEHIEINQESTEEITIRGFSLSYLLAQRLTVPPNGYAYHSFNSPVEDIMVALVKANVSDPIDNNRKIPNLIVENSKGRGESLQFQTRYKVLADELTKLSKATSLGWTIDLDYKNKKIIFKVLQGRDLTSTQRVNPPAIFSIHYDNILNQNYIDSNIGYKNVGYVAGQGEGTERKLEILSNELTGFDRRETFIDARDIEEGSLSDRGKVKLAETPQIQSFECEVNTKDYRNTWNLGDIVTIVDKKFNVKIDNAVMEVREVYETTGFKVEPTFGTTIPLPGEKIKQITDTPLNEGLQGADSIPLVTTTKDGLMVAADKIKLNNSYIKSEVDNLISTAVNNLINGAPGAFDTLIELANAMGNDPNFATTITNALATKVDKVVGKQLSTEDFTTALLAKLNGIAAGANNYTHPSTHAPSIIAQDTSNRFVTDAEKTTWNARTKKYSVNVGNGTATTITVTHGLGTMDVTVSLREVTSPYNGVMTDWRPVDNNSIQLLFAVAPTSGQYRVVVIG